MARYAFTFCIAALLAAASLGQANTDGLKKRVNDWVAANYTGGNEKVGGFIREKLDAGSDLVATFGAGVMKQGKATQLIVFAGRFYAVPLSAEQASALLRDGATFDITPHKRWYLVGTPQAALKGLKIADAKALDPTKRVTGTVNLDITGTLPAKALLRMTFRTPKGSTELFTRLPEGARSGPLSFSFQPMLSEADKDLNLSGPMVVFIDICTVEERTPGSDSEVKMHSTPVGTMLNMKKADVAAPSGPDDLDGPGSTPPAVVPGPRPGIVPATKPTTPASAGLVGSKWKFPGTSTVIELQAGGKLLWNGEAIKAEWKQEGDKVTINVNDFTLFELTLVSADKMTGTWKRLKGDDVGLVAPSGLERIK